MHENLTRPKELAHVGGLVNVKFLDKQPAIYFLVRAGVVVYVGQSVVPRQRIATHSREGTKKFDSAYMRPCSEGDLDELESHFIHLLSPEYNCTLPDGTKLAPVSLCDAQDRARALLKTTAKKPEPAFASTAPPPPAPPSQASAARLLRLPEVMLLCGLRRTSIYKGMSDGTFPKCVKFGRAALWREVDVLDFIARVSAIESRA